LLVWASNLANYWETILFCSCAKFLKNLVCFIWLLFRLSGILGVGKLMRGIIQNNTFVLGLVSSWGLSKGWFTAMGVRIQLKTLIWAEARVLKLIVRQVGYEHLEMNANLRSSGLSSSSCMS